MYMTLHQGLILDGLGLYQSSPSTLLLAAHVAERHGLYPTDVAGDGSCMLRSLCLSAGFPEDMHEDLRAVCVAQVAQAWRADSDGFGGAAAKALLRRDQDEAEAFVTEDDYYSAALESNFFLGDAELSAAMTHLGISIVIHSSSAIGEVSSYRVPRPEGCSLPEVHLLRVNDNHYIALRFYSAGVGYIPQLASPIKLTRGHGSRPGAPVVVGIRLSPEKVDALLEKQAASHVRHSSLFAIKLHKRRVLVSVCTQVLCLHFKVAADFSLAERPMTCPCCSVLIHQLA